MSLGRIREKLRRTYLFELRMTAAKLVVWVGYDKRMVFLSHANGKKNFRENLKILLESFLWKFVVFWGFKRIWCFQISSKLDKILQISTKNLSLFNFNSIFSKLPLIIPTFYSFHGTLIPTSKPFGFFQPESNKCFCFARFSIVTKSNRNVIEHFQLQLSFCWFPINLADFYGNKIVILPWDWKFDRVF